MASYSELEELVKKWDDILSNEGLAPIDRRSKTHSVNFEWSTHSRWVGEHSVSDTLAGARTQLWCKSLDIGLDDRWLSALLLEELGIGEREASRIVGVCRTTYRDTVVKARQATRDVANDETASLDFQRHTSKYHAIKRHRQSYRFVNPNK